MPLGNFKLHKLRKNVHTMLFMYNSILLILFITLGSYNNVNGAREQETTNSEEIQNKFHTWKTNYECGV